MEAHGFPIIMIDDAPGDIESLRRCLERIPEWDVQLLGFTDWPKAQAALQGEPAAPLLLDYHLGARNGLDLVSELRASGDGRPLILLTGAGDETLATQALRQGADDYLNKNTLGPDNLRRSLVISMTQARLRQEKAASITTLESSERKFRTFFETSRDGIVFTDMEGHIQEVNAAYLDMLGYTAAEIRETTYQQITPPRWHAIEAVIVQDQVLARGYSVPYEKEYIRKDGSIFPVALTTWLLRDERGMPTGMWAIMRDITERKRAEEALRQSSKMESLGLTAGGLAHNFNNQFQAILGNLEIVKMSLLPGSSAVVALARALKALSRSTDISHHMLEYTGKAPLRMETVHLNQFLQQQRSMFTARKPSNVRIEFDLAPDLPPIFADTQMLLQALNMLLTNALEALGQGSGRIWIRTCLSEAGAEGGILNGWMERPPHGPFVLISIEDSGPGIPPGHLSRIFDPFFTTKEIGRGLGLAVTLGILRGHKGGIQVENAEGRGSTFRLAFSACADLTRPEIPAHVVVPEQRQTILVVDDDEDVRTTLADILLGILGYPVLEARNGLEATEIFRLRESAIGLVLMDMMMPYMNGVEAFERMKKTQPGVRGILMSGFSKEEGNQMVLEHGFQSFIQKPYSIDELKVAIQYALGRNAESGQHS